MTIEYSNSEFTQSHRALMTTRAKGLLCPRGRYYWNTFFPIVLFGVGAFSAFTHGGSPLFLILGFMLTGHTVELLYRWRPYDRWLHNLFFPEHLNGDLRRIRLEIGVDGLREHQGDIVSFAPWKDVVDTILEGDLLVIKLSSSQEALIPAKSFGISELNLEDVRSEIDRRRITNDRNA